MVVVRMATENNNTANKIELKEEEIKDDSNSNGQSTLNNYVVEIEYECTECHKNVPKKKIEDKGKIEKYKSDVIPHKHVESVACIGNLESTGNVKYNIPYKLRCNICNPDGKNSNFELSYIDADTDETLAKKIISTFGSKKIKGVSYEHKLNSSVNCGGNLQVFYEDNHHIELIIEELFKKKKKEKSEKKSPADNNNNIQESKKISWTLDNMAKTEGLLKLLDALDTLIFISQTPNPIKRSILLVGPYATGKSIMVKAAMNHDKYKDHFHYVKIGGKFTGFDHKEVDAGVEEIFANAMIEKGKKPMAVLHADEIAGTIGTRRKASRTQKVLVDAILRAMTDYPDVIIIGSANDISEADVSILHSGRFDIIHVKKATTPEQRTQILRSHMIVILPYVRFDDRILENLITYEKYHNTDWDGRDYENWTVDVSKWCLKNKKVTINPEEFKELLEHRQQQIEKDKKEDEEYDKESEKHFTSLKGNQEIINPEIVFDTIEKSDIVDNNTKERVRNIRKIRDNKLLDAEQYSFVMDIYNNIIKVGVYEHEKKINDNRSKIDGNMAKLAEEVLS